MLIYNILMPKNQPSLPPTEAINSLMISLEYGEQKIRNKTPIQSGIAQDSTYHNQWGICNDNAISIFKYKPMMPRTILYM